MLVSDMARAAETNTVMLNNLGSRLLRASLSMLTLGLAIGGCTNVEVGTFNAPKIGDYLRLPSMSAPVAVEQNKPVAAEDLVDAEGRCASTPMAAVPPAPEAPGADPVTTPANPALAAGGIGLGMSECDVVKRAGPPEKIEVGTSERSERIVTLTYLKSTRPGIYKFVAGRLNTIERVEVPPEPKPKPVKPTKTVKPKPKPAAT
jgi:hypothetical protein